MSNQYRKSYICLNFLTFHCGRILHIVIDVLLRNLRVWVAAKEVAGSREVQWFQC